VPVLLRITHGTKSALPVSPPGGTAEKPLLMRSRLQFVFPPFHFQNGGRRIKDEHVIVMALGNVLPAQGIYKQLDYFGQSPVQIFRL